MKLLKQLLSFYINSSIHVALSVVSLAGITMIEYGIYTDVAMLFFLFFSSITGYNFVKYFGVAKFHHRSLASSLQYIQIFSFFCFILMCYFALKLHTKTLVYVAGFGVITFLYAIPIVSKKIYIDKQHNLRSIGGLKIYLIAFVWSGVTVFLPLIEQEYTMSVHVFITAIQRFVLVMVLMLPFEIRDLRYDSLRLATIPQKIGVKKTKVMGIVLLAVFLFLAFFKAEIHVAEVSVLIILLGITLLFLIFSKVEQRKYYSSFWVESLPIFWLLLLVLFC